MLKLYDELATRFDFDGVSLDRIRYPDGNFCHCGYCKAQFKKDTGLGLARFAPGTAEHRAWDGWRKKQLAGFMRKARERLRLKAPDKELTSAVVAPDLIDEKGQDWPAWLADGSVDAVMPMLYLKDLAPALRRIDKLVPAGARIFHGISAELGEDRLLAQIRQLREARSSGITVWFAGPVDPYLEELGRGLFADKAQSPLD